MNINLDDILRFIITILGSFIAVFGTCLISWICGREKGDPLPTVKATILYLLYLSGLLILLYYIIPADIKWLVMYSVAAAIFIDYILMLLLQKGGEKTTAGETVARLLICIALSITLILLLGKPVDDGQIDDTAPVSAIAQSTVSPTATAIQNTVAPTFTAALSTPTVTQFLVLNYIMPSYTVLNTSIYTTKDVYSGPGDSYYRSAGGGAIVSTKGWIRVYAQDNGWFLIEYGTGSNDITQRFGYIETSSLISASSTPVLPKANVSVSVKTSCAITDEPNKGKTPMATINSGEKVTYLCMYGSYAYVEYLGGSKPMRGFIIASRLDLP